MNLIKPYTTVIFYSCIFLAKAACPQWNLISPCTCTDASDGFVVECIGTGENSQKILSTLESIETSESWELQLSGLNIEELPATVVTVSSLRISKSSIVRLLRTPPLLWPNLDELVLEEVKMFDQPWSHFQGAHSLKSIKVSGYLMQTIGKDFRANVPESVEYLDFRKTGTTKLEQGCMDHLINLRYVFIADVPLAEFPRNALPDQMPLLHTFIFGNTLIETLQSDFFDGMPKLEVLMINGNRFDTLDPQLFMGLRNHLTYLLADRNPLQCECNLLWLKKNFQTKRSIEVLATCYDISSHNMKEVMSLNESDYCSQ